MTEYRNPAPVVVGIICPEPDKIVIVQRAIEPFIGEWALPGGYVNYGEDWRFALAREIEEETMIEVEANSITPYDVRSTPDGSRILIFGLIKKITRIRDFVPNEEATNLTFASFTRHLLPSLCFPLHSAVITRYADPEGRVRPRQCIVMFLDRS